MKRIDFYLDFVSPYAWLAFQALPRALEGCAYQVRYRPVLLGALFKMHGLTSPAEVPGKHAWIRRHTEWLAARAKEGDFAWPASHPFDSLPLLRLAMACSRDGAINRFTAETVFRHVWDEGGAAALDAERLQELEQRLAGQLRSELPVGSAANKARLRANTEEAAAAGVFGAPSYCVEGELLWGLDALPMLRDRLENAAGQERGR